MQPVTKDILTRHVPGWAQMDDWPLIEKLAERLASMEEAIALEQKRQNAEIERVHQAHQRLIDRFSAAREALKAAGIETEDVAAGAAQLVSNADELRTDRDAARKVAEGLRKALYTVREMIDSGELVRDISKDHKSDWATKALPFVIKLNQMNQALEMPLPWTAKEVEDGQS